MLTFFTLLSLASVVLASTKGEVKVLDPANFDQTIKSSPFTFVEFYAPWCGHCKSLAPIWDQLAESFKDNNQVVIAKTDADEHKEIATQYEIQGFPTLKWFSQDGKAEDYKSGRDLDALKDFVAEKLNIKLKKAPSHVKVLDASNFKEVVGTEDQYTLVEFYAPWCGHCKNLAPVYEKVAKAFSIEEHVVVAKCDGDANRELAEEYDVKGFPTLILFKPNGEGTVVYDSGRTEGDFVTWLNEKAGTHRLPGGDLDQDAGRLAQLDALAQSFVTASADKYDEIIKSTRKLVKEVNSEASKYYLKTMEKIKANKSVSYLQKEMTRLSALTKDMAMGKNRDWFTMRNNILSAFTSAPKSAADKVADQMEDTFHDAKEAVGDLYEEGEDALGQAHRAVDDAAAKAKAAAGSAKDKVKAAAEGVKDKVTGAKKAVKEEADVVKDEL